MPTLETSELQQREPDIASLFVDLVLKHDWPKVQDLSPEEVRILFDTVSAAGLEPKAIVLGKLVGHYRDQDGSSTGETYPINSINPYKVLDREGKDHYFATGWLDQALRSVRRSTDHQRLVENIRKEIQRSIPLKPMQLTAEGDMLREYPPSFYSTYFVDHTRDDKELSICVGLHDYCNGWVDRNRATETHDGISCRKCNLRVLFVKEIKTYGELRQALAAKFAQISA